MLPAAAILSANSKPCSSNAAGGSDPLGQLQALLQQQGSREQNLELIRNPKDGTIIGACLGITEEIRAKTKPQQAVDRVAKAVAEGEARPDNLELVLSGNTIDVRQLCRRVKAALGDFLEKAVKRSEKS
jgi:hypothetical protein